MELCAISFFSPIAFNTWDGSRFALLQAEPVEQAMPFIFIINVSASIFGKQKLILFDNRFSLFPFKIVSGCEVKIHQSFYRAVFLAKHSHFPFFLNTFLSP